MRDVGAGRMRGAGPKHHRVRERQRDRRNNNADEGAGSEDRANAAGGGSTAVTVWRSNDHVVQPGTSLSAIYPVWTQSLAARRGELLDLTDPHKKDLRREESDHFVGVSNTCGSEGWRLMGGQP